MHLNHFLPRPPSGGPEAGPLRRMLRAFGPTWEAAPVRRVAQAVSLALFLILFFYVSWPYGAKDYAALRESKELAAAETFLALDPLVSLSTALAARAWVWSLVWAAVLLAACLFVPRGFCGYVCPLGTLADLFDWVLGKRAARRLAVRDGGWVHLRYYVLAAVIVAAAMGVLVSGFVAAIPVLVRGMAFIASPLQTGLVKGGYLVPPIGAGQVVSIVLFLAVLALGLVRPRFWCRHLCPSGAVFSVANHARLMERQVEPTCIGCGQCVKACPFGAINPDFSTRAADCTFCQTCGGVCPVRAIRFAPRWAGDLMTDDAAGATACLSSRDMPCATAGLSGRDMPRATAGLSGRASGVGASLNHTGCQQPVAPRICVSRRGFLGGAVGGVAAAIGVRHVGGAEAAAPVIRPPGSVPESAFLRLCIRCGACYQACPNNVLQPMGMSGGLDGLWTPRAVPEWSGCEPTCNNCGHVCPTGAIRALAIEEKRAARMGLAVINKETCLPYIGAEGACRLCYDECKAAGYDAVEFVRVNVEMDTDGKPIEDTGTRIPVVVPEKCVGCGLCQTRCHKINVVAQKLLDATAIRIEAGPGKEDRLMTGSYLALRAEERRQRAERQKKAAPGGDTYLPEFLK